MFRSNGLKAKATSYVEPMVELVELDEQSVICTSATGTLPGANQDDWGTI